MACRETERVQPALSVGQSPYYMRKSAGQALTAERAQQKRVGRLPNRSRTGKSYCWTTSDAGLERVNTRNRLNAKLSCFSLKSTFYAGFEIFNSSPCSLTILKNENSEFKKKPLRKCLNTHFFYPVDDFLCVKMIYNTIV
jgi:hypothetical protein